MLPSSVLNASDQSRHPVAYQHLGFVDMQVCCLPLPWFITTGETMTQNQADLSALNQGSTGGNKFSPHQHAQRQLGQVIQTE